MRDNADVRDSETAFGILVQLTRELSEHALELDAALHTVTDAALALFDLPEQGGVPGPPGGHSSVRILDEQGERLLSAARSGVGTASDPARFRRGEGVIGWVIEHGDIVRLGDAPNDERFVKIDKQGYQIRSLLAVPLWSAGCVIGALATSRAAAGYFSEDDEVLARLLANCAVPPIERARLQRIAQTDALTGALNSGQLIRVLEQTMADAASASSALCILSLDLDHFKRVNDNYGHAAGDQVLRAFAQRVRGSIRDEDFLIRRGGEEFIVVLPRCDLAMGARAAERMRIGMERHPVHVADERISQKVSIGVAEWDSAESPESLDGRADTALYVAKRAGRNRIALAPAP